MKCLFFIITILVISKSAHAYIVDTLTCRVAAYHDNFETPIIVATPNLKVVRSKIYTFPDGEITQGRVDLEGHVVYGGRDYDFAFHHIYRHGIHRDSSGNITAAKMAICSFGTFDHEFGTQHQYPTDLNSKYWKVTSHSPFPMYNTKLDSTVVSDPYSEELGPVKFVASCGHIRSEEIIETKVGGTYELR